MYIVHNVKKLPLMPWSYYKKPNKMVFKRHS